jgi:hypothetical protein
MRTWLVEKKKDIDDKLERERMIKEASRSKAKPVGKTNVPE